MSTDVAETEVRVPIPSGAKLSVRDGKITASGPLGTVHRPFPSDAIAFATKGVEVVLTLRIPANRKRAKSLLHTWERHVANLAGGVTRGFEAKMKAVAAHFPMKVQAREHELLIENFLGEKHPRSAPLVAGVTAVVDGEFVILSGFDVELVGQSAANIERATKIRDYDPRVFQDGIYIIERAHLKESG